MTKLRCTTLIVLFTALGMRLSAQVTGDRLIDGTPVKIQLQQFISSDTSKAGDPVRLTVVTDVRAAAGRVIIPHGTVVSGTIMEAVPPQVHEGLWAYQVAPGRLALHLDHTISVDDQTIRLRATAWPSATSPPVGISVMSSMPDNLLRWAYQGVKFEAFVDGDYMIP